MAAAWTYSDWITLTDPAAQLTRLNLHIQEVANKITADTAAHGYSRNSTSLTTYMASLMEARSGLLAAALPSGGVSLAEFRE